MSWLERNKNTIIRSAFLVPILLVVIISISHVVKWYSIGNPFNWAIYLSIAIEIFALSAVSAASININKGTIWFLFILVTLIQLIGNVFFSYNQILVDSEIFKSWVELITPIFQDWDVLAHKRFLALIQGGTLPIMSLTALHFYLKFNQDTNKSPEFVPTVYEKVEDGKEENNDAVNDAVNDADKPESEIVEMVEQESFEKPESEIKTDEVVLENGSDSEMDKEIPQTSTSIEDDKDWIRKLREKRLKESSSSSNNTVSRVGTNKFQDDGSKKIIFNGKNNKIT